MLKNKLKKDEENRRKINQSNIYSAGEAIRLAKCSRF